MRGRLTICSGAWIVVLLCFVGWVGRASAYSTYNPSTTSNGCYQCHPSFENRGALHDMHVGNTQMTNNCDLCHQSVGDNPNTSSSAAGVSCIGCHLPEGLRLHHQAAEAPPDGEGRTCSACHSGDGTPAAENVDPPYYTRTDVSVDDPCVVAAGSGGEDWDSDGTGLDNDGDLLYEGDDDDCPTAVHGATWGTVKALYVK